jgi:hypothetical protein
LPVDRPLGGRDIADLLADGDRLAGAPAELPREVSVMSSRRAPFSASS